MGRDVLYVMQGHKCKGIRHHGHGGCLKIQKVCYIIYEQPIYFVKDNCNLNYPTIFTLSKCKNSKFDKTRVFPSGKTSKNQKQE